MWIAGHWAMSRAAADGPTMPRRTAAQPVRSPAPPPDPERTVTISFPVSEPLHIALKVRAAQERTTVRGMMMQGLKALGFDVPDADLTDRRPGRSGRRDAQP